MATDFSNFTITHLTGAYTNPSCLTRLGKKFGRIMVADNLPQAKSFLADGKADVIFAPRREIPGLKVFDHPFHCEKSGSAVMTWKGSPLIGWWNKAFEAFVKSGGYQKLCEEGRAKYNFNIRCLADKDILSNLWVCFNFFVEFMPAYMMQHVVNEIYVKDLIWNQWIFCDLTCAKFAITINC